MAWIQDWAASHLGVTVEASDAELEAVLLQTLRRKHYRSPDLLLAAYSVLRSARNPQAQLIPASLEVQKSLEEFACVEIELFAKSYYELSPDQRSDERDLLVGQAVALVKVGICPLTVKGKIRDEGVDLSGGAAVSQRSMRVAPRPSPSRCCMK